ncbi:MAG: hypothetical protein IPJ68_04785 [Candidatus Moraniibacteriota bacterium]|nr:MAG: hypothetical protein IPJ68_04785 [Candidatus Moranbacteria bacterium]
MQTQTTAEKQNEKDRRDNRLARGALVHGFITGVSLAIGGVNPWVAGAAVGFTFIIVYSLFSIRALLTELAEK